MSAEELVAGSVFVKRAGDVDAVFAKVEIFGADTVTRLAKRASLELDWHTSAAYVDLFLVKPEGDDEPTAAEEEAALAKPRLQVGWALSRARISSGAWVVARLSSPPAAAPGECARAARSLLSCLPSRGAEGDVREIPLRSSRRSPISTLSFLSPVFLQLAAVAAVAAAAVAASPPQQQQLAVAAAAALWQRKGLSLRTWRSLCLSQKLKRACGFPPLASTSNFCPRIRLSPSQS